MSLQLSGLPGRQNGPNPRPQPHPVLAAWPAQRIRLARPSLCRPRQSNPYFGPRCVTRRAGIAEGALLCVAAEALKREFFNENSR